MARALRPPAARSAVLRSARSFSYELRTQPVTLWFGVLLAVAIAAAVIMPFTGGDLARQASIGDDTVVVGDPRDIRDALRDVYTAGGVAGLVAMLWAGVTVAGTHRHGSIIVSALATPRRANLALGMALGVGAGGLLAGAATAAAAGVLVPVLSDREGLDVAMPPGEVRWLLVLTVVHGVLSAAIGAGLALVLGDQALVAVLVVAAFGIVGPVLGGLADGVAVLVPTGAAAAMLGDDAAGAKLAGTVAYAGWTALVLLGGIAALHARDLR